MRLFRLEVAEEVGGRVDDHHVVLLGKAFAIGLKAAVKPRELGVSSKGMRIDLRSLSVTFTLDLLGVAIGLGEDDLALAVCGRADAFSLSSTLGTFFARYALALGLHASIDRFRNFRRKVNALHAHVNDADAHIAHALLEEL